MKELLQGVELLAGIDRRLLAEVAGAGVARRYQPGDTIVEQGQTGLGMYLVIRGQVGVRRSHRGGPASLARQLAVLGPEQVFAEMALLDDQPRSASVVALEETECLLLTRDRFTVLMRKFPELPVRVARVLAGRLRAANDRLLTEAAAAAAPTPSLEPALAPPVNRLAPSRPSPAATPAKRQIEGAFLSLFQGLAVMKAMTSFSVAVLGCPVEVVGPGRLECLRAGEVQAVVVPATEPSKLEIVATAPGAFTLHLLSAGEAQFCRSGPHAIERGDVWRLQLAGPRALLSAPKDRR